MRQSHEFLGEQPITLELVMVMHDPEPLHWEEIRSGYDWAMGFFKSVVAKHDPHSYEGKEEIVHELLHALGTEKNLWRRGTIVRILLDVIQRAKGAEQSQVLEVFRKLLRVPLAGIVHDSQEHSFCRFWAFELLAAIDPDCFEGTGALINISRNEAKRVLDEMASLGMATDTAFQKFERRLRNN